MPDLSFSSEVADSGQMSESELIDQSSRTDPSFNTSVPKIRKGKDTSLIADFAVLALEGLSTRDALNLDGAPLPDPQSSSDDTTTIPEERDPVIENMDRKIKGAHERRRKLGGYISLARVLLLLEAKRFAAVEGQYKRLMTEAVDQAEAQAACYFQLPGVDRVIVVATTGKTWRWAMVRRFGDDVKESWKDSTGKRHVVEFIHKWSRDFSLETQESEDEWRLVVTMVEDLLEEVEVAVELA